MAFKFNFGFKPVARFILVKIFGISLAIIFLFLGVLFLSYSLISGVATAKGTEAKITTISSQLGKCHTASRFGGLYQVGVTGEKSKAEKIYCFYPAWPDIFQPTKGDAIKVWPAKKPLVGSVPTEGWGWFLLGTLLIVGFVMLEFSFLAFTLR